MPQTIEKETENVPDVYFHSETWDLESGSDCRDSDLLPHDFCVAKLLLLDCLESVKCSYEPWNLTLNWSDPSELLLAPPEWSFSAPINLLEERLLLFELLDALLRLCALVIGCLEKTFGVEKFLN